jgi:hypothetical protein
VKTKRLFLRMIVLTLVSLLPVACSTPQPTITPIPLTATFTSVPPTATNTPVPPTVTNTPVPPTPTSKPPTATNTPVPPTATTTYTSTPLPALCEGVEGNCLEIRFEKGSCTHVGPETVPAGQITLVFSNYTSSNAGIDLEILDEGKTWGAMKTYMSPLPFTGSQPDWSKDVITRSVHPGESTTSQIELSAGTYISVCGRSNPHQVWLGVQLIVED